MITRDQLRANCDQSQTLMADNENPFPPYVRLFRAEANDRPPVIGFDADSMITRAERKVCDFFKCTKNWEMTEKTDWCYATRHTTLSFENHLKERHSSDHLFCVYCFELKKNSEEMKNLKKYHWNQSSQSSQSSYLIRHMVKRHRFRRFQCSLCLYRAITADHVICHQKLDHETEYKITVSGSCSDSPDSDGCKIFCCQLITETESESVPELKFYLKYKKERLNINDKKTYLQCLYCQFMSEQLSKVVEHAVQTHPDYPLLYYLPEHQISSSNVQLDNDFLKLNDIPIRPKVEPQDNSISSTQKIAESDTGAHKEVLAKKRALSFDDSLQIETSSSEKRIRTEDIVPVLNPNQLSCTSTSTLTANQSMICLFCNEILNDPKSGKSHMKTHFDCEHTNDPRIVRWIEKFISKQWQLSSFEDIAVKPQTKRAYYYCPLCQRLAEICNKKPKSYKTFSEVRYHLWEHSSWQSVKCKICDIHISNCDSIIAKHIRENHENSIRNKFGFLDLKNEPIEWSFTEEQRSNLEKRFLMTQTNAIIESMINQLLLDIKKNNEKERCLIERCGSPRIQMERLLNYGNKSLQKYHKEYLEYEDKKKNKSNGIAKKKETAKEPKPKKSKTSINDLTDCSNSSDVSLNSRKSKDGSDKGKELLTQVHDIDKLLPSTSRDGIRHKDSDPNTSRCNLVPPQSGGTQEMEANKDTDSVVEESKQISCLRCNDKFKTRKEFNEHHKRSHPNVSRMYAKPGHD